MTSGEFVDIYHGDRWIGRVSREVYEDELEVAKALRQYIDQAIAQAAQAMDRLPDG